MAGSIKIQHGATASTPQAGFSTIWASSADGEFYVKKPDGSVESLVGATGAQGPTGSVGATGVGLGLSARNLYYEDTDFVYNVGTTNYELPVAFTQSFASTNYSIDVQYKNGTNGRWYDFSNIPNIGIENKTASGFDLVLLGGFDPTGYTDWYVQAIALGETSVSNYGNFLSTVSQPNAGATAANAITYNTTDLTSGVSVVSSSRITIANAGIYNIQFSAQLQKTSGGDDQIDIWLAKNGSNVANSNTTMLLHSNPGYEVAAWNFLVQANAADYYELYWSSADTTAEIHASAAGTNPTRPAIPSVILSVTQVSTA